MPPTNPGVANLVAYWSMDETGGTRADSSANGLDLTDNNTVGSATGVVGNAASLVQANSEYLSHANDALFDFTTQFSIGFWRRKDTTTPSYQYSYLREHTGYSYGVITCEEYGASANVCIENASGYLAVSSLFDDDTWTYITVVYDGGGATDAERLKVYKNGSQVSGTIVGTIASSLTNGDGAFIIGKRLTLYAEGEFDEFVVFNDALTADEVSWLYNGGAGRSYADLSGGGATFQPAWAAGCNVFRGVV